MQRLKCNKSTYIDIDDTLIIWNPPKDQLDKHGMDFDHTYDNGDRRTGKILPHKVHIQQLKEHAMRGHTVILWSAGGEEWAYAAAKSLGLEDYVSYTIEKPIFAYDDKKPNEFFETKYMEDK